MKKKYYFNSTKFSLIYILIEIVLVACLVSSFFADEFHFGTIFIITSFAIGVFVVLFWIVFSFCMRIQIDYDKKELYIIHPFYLKKLKFEKVLSIQIVDYNEVDFDFVINTNNRSKKLAYTRYYKSKPNNEIKLKISELKNDLINIFDKNF